MALLFAAGVMNLFWVATIAAFVLSEKVLPRGDLVGRVTGGMLVLSGIVFLARSDNETNMIGRVSNGSVF
jgi:predicted metal-binding membrane protein